MYLVDSVLPAPDSPLTMIDWLHFRTFMSRYALSAGMNNELCIVEYKTVPLARENSTCFQLEFVRHSSRGFF